MTKVLQQYRFDLLALGAFLFLLPFFFYRLGQSSLVSWDEAWYAEIARNILKTGDLFNLSWNGMAYYDHPPVGFWLIALSEALFGFNSFGVQIASALTGFLAVLVTFFWGKEMFNRVVGWCSGMGLASSFWFLFRSRSGNLDIFLTFFFLLTFYTAWKARNNEKWLWVWAISFSLLILTKTGIPLVIIPSLVIIFWQSKIRFKSYLGPVGLVVLFGGIWLVSQFLSNNSFFVRYLQIGLPGVEVKTAYWDNFELAKTYVHDGIGKWFWPGIVGLGGSIIIGLIELIGGIKESRRWWILSIFGISFFGPFVLSPKGHIWHLIPLYPVMILSFFGVSYWLAEKVVGYLDIWLLRKKIAQYRSSLIAIALVVIALFVSSSQLRSAWVQFIDQPKYISDEQILSTEAGKVKGEFFIDDDFGPTAVWYSGKNVKQIRDDDVRRLFNKEAKFGQVGQFLLITKQYRLDGQGIAKEQYRILKSNRDKILIISN